MAVFDAKKLFQRIVDVLVFTDKSPLEFFKGMEASDDEFEKMLV